MGSVDDYISQATDLLNREDVDEAIRLYREALKLDPNDPTALTGLGTALDESGELESAIDCYKKALRADPKDVIAHSGLGVAYEKLGSSDLAIREYRAALSLDKEAAALHIKYARERHERGLLMEKKAYESKLTELEELISRYSRTAKTVDRSISKLFPK
jgi:Flp pilus assembly protein TadD